MKRAYSVIDMCRVFNLCISSYYYKPINVSDKYSKEITKIKDISRNSKNTYGKRRIHDELKDNGYKIGIYRTKSLMDVANIKVIMPKKKHYYSDSGQEHKYTENLLNRNFNPKDINRYWVGDITYIKTGNKWVYLATVMDLYSREVIGSAVSDIANASLSKEALNNAIKNKKPRTINLTFHSDQGCQYSAKEFRDNLKLHKITQSMSRRGNCWDNSVQERFYRSLKSESLNLLTRKSIIDTIKQTQSYIYFYNYKRRHSTIGYLTPNEKSKIGQYTA